MQVWNQKIIQVINSIPCVCCASGNVFITFHTVTLEWKQLLCNRTKLSLTQIISASSLSHVGAQHHLLRPLCFLKTSPNHSDRASLGTLVDGHQCPIQCGAESEFWKARMTMRRSSRRQTGGEDGGGQRVEGGDIIVLSWAPTIRKGTLSLLPGWELFSSKTNRGKEEMDCVSGKMEPARAK